MRSVKISILLFFFFSTVSAQETIAETLQKFNIESVAYISVEELSIMDDMILLDTRNRKEFDVSHLKEAIWVGYKEFSIDSVISLILVKNSKIVVYCSVGVRSEDIGEILMANGYTQVKNLYGGIFEWKNQGHPVFDADSKETNKVHAYSKKWGRLLTNAQKVY